jgi:hypothetical protein
MNMKLTSELFKQIGLKELEIAVEVQLEHLLKIKLLK